MNDKNLPLWLIIIVSMLSLIAFGYLIGINSYQHSETTLISIISCIFTVLGGATSLIALLFAFWVFKQWRNQRDSNVIHEQYLSLIADFIELRNNTVAVLINKLFAGKNTYLDSEKSKVTRRIHISLEKIRAISEVKSELEEQINYLLVSCENIHGSVAKNDAQEDLIVHFNGKLYDELKEKENIIESLKLLDSGRLIYFEFIAPNPQLFSLVKNHIQRKVETHTNILINRLRKELKKI